VKNPTDGVTGKICPMGYYCPEGATVETACPIGTFRDAEGGTSLTDCIICDAG